MRNLIALAATAALLVVPASAQTGPKFGRNGGVGAADSTMTNGEPTGGTFSINGQTGSGTFNGVIAARDGGAIQVTPNYPGVLTDSPVLAVDGSRAAPTSTAAAAGVFQKWSNNHEFNSLAGLAYKTSGNVDDRATGVYGEAADLVGGSGSSVEGGRYQGTLLTGSNGSAYGGICVAGIDPTFGATAPRYLVGCEAEIDNQVGPDAPTFSGFNKDRFSASFLASQGVGTGTRYKVDGAFVINPYSLGKYQTGLLLTSAVSNAGVAATAGTSLVSGIDLSLASLSYASLVAPNNAPIRFRNAAGTAGLNVLNLTTADDLAIGQDIAGRVRVAAPMILGTASGGLFYSGSIDATAAFNSANWVETLRPFSTSISQTVSTSTAGNIALLGASRSAGNGCGGGCMGTIGGELIALNDNVLTNQRQYAYAGYFEATRAANAGTTHGVEIDVRNRGSLVAITPYAMFGDGVTVGGSGATPGLWLASGAGETGSADNTVALGIVANGSRWRSGIMFDANGLVQRSDNKYEAIDLAPRQAISFFDTNGAVLGNIYSFGTPGGPGMNLEIKGDGVAVENGGGVAQFNVGVTGTTYQRGPLQLISIAFAALPACNTQSAGTLAFINDAPAPITAWHQVVSAGGGSNPTFVQCTSGGGWQAF